GPLHGPALQGATYRSALAAGWRGALVGPQRLREARMGKPSWPVALLLSIPFVGLLSNAVLIPVLPKVAGALHIPYQKAAWLIVVPSVVAGFFIPVGGYLSDRWTRTIVLAPSLFLYGAAGLLAAL